MVYTSPSVGRNRVQYLLHTGWLDTVSTAYRMIGYSIYFIPDDWIQYIRHSRLLGTTSLAYLMIRYSIYCIPDDWVQYLLLTGWLDSVLSTPFQMIGYSIFGVQYLLHPGLLGSVSTAFRMIGNSIFGIPDGWVQHLRHSRWLGTISLAYRMIGCFLGEFLVVKIKI